MGKIKGINQKDLTEVEDIQKRWQEYRKLYKKKKKVNHLDNYNVVVTYLEPDILECEVKWALIQTKLLGVMEFQLSYFKS